VQSDCAQVIQWLCAAQFVSSAVWWCSADVPFLLHMRFRLRGDWMFHKFWKWIGNLCFRTATKVYSPNNSCQKEGQAKWNIVIFNGVSDGGQNWNCAKGTRMWLSETDWSRVDILVRKYRLCTCGVCFQSQKV